MIEQIKQDFLRAIDQPLDDKSLEGVRVLFLGKKSLLSDQFSKLRLITNNDQKAAAASTLNELRAFITERIQEKKTKIAAASLQQKIDSEYVDVTLPPKPYSMAKMHPISKTISQITEILTNMGFLHVQDREIETQWHNFDALNIEKMHPARQMADTFYVEGARGTNPQPTDYDSQNDDLVLRTHTSSVQIRHMSSNQPPYKIISSGKVYRSDYDATHTPMFHQIEGLYIDKDIGIEMLIGCLKELLSSFFQISDLPIRIRPSYFPFTTPSLEIDIRYDKKNGTKIGAKGDNWLEVLGCGMVHQNVLKAVNVDHNKYRGFAFGLGVERLAMLKYNIPDLRSMFACDLRWMKHYENI